MAIFQKVEITIDDGAADVPTFVQTTGLAQSNKLSPHSGDKLLRGGGTTEKRESHPVIYARSRVHVEQALARLQATIAAAGPTINVQKTRAIKFRKGGRVSRND